jgi:general secretion pathway protein E
MHSGTPAGALLRLLEMGIEPYQVTSSISAVLNQRLVRRLCTACRRPVAEGRFEPVGCEMCFGTGFKGRALIAEMIQLDSDLRKAILAKADLDELEALLVGKGHVSILQDGWRLVRDGTTTEAELNKACGIALEG